MNASGDLGLSASNMNLFAAKDTTDLYSFVGGGGNSTEIRTHNEALTGTTLSAGGSLTLVSQQDIFSQGSTLNSGEGITLAAGGDIMLASAEAYNSSFKEVKTKSSGFFGSKKSTKTSTSESLTNLGTSLTSGGDIQMVSGSDILLSGTKATAAGDIGLQAAGDIRLLSAVDQTSSRYQEQKKGSIKVSSKDQGSITQTAVTSELAGANISLTSGSNIALQGATLTANNTLSMGAASGTLQAVTQNADGNYVSANGEQVGNVTVGTQALQNSSWSESSSGFRGVFKDLVKGIAVVAAVATGGLVHGEIKVGEANATRTDTLTQQTSTLAGNDLLIKAKDTIALIGAKISATALASLDANDITIDAAHEQTVVTTSHTEQTVSGKGATLQKDQISLASITETDQTERTTTTANTWQGSNISAGNLTLSANNNLAILASDISVDNNADIKAQNILVGGREATTETTHDSITKTKTLTVGVKNAYVDVALAAEALKDAKDAVSDAKNAYDDAKQKVADGKLPASDLDFYKVNLAAATANLASATTAVYSAGVAATAAASTSAGTGFYASAGVTTQIDTTSTTSTQGIWNGSNINVGNNANLISNNNLNIEGSSINTAGQLALDAQNINITAGKNTYTESSKSHSEGGGINVSMQPTTTSYSGSVNASQSRSDYQSTDYVNSQIGAGSLVSNSDNLTIKGGNVSADKIDITTGGLTVESLQNTSSGSSTSAGFSVSASLGGSDKGWEGKNEDPTKSPAASGVTGFGGNASKGNSEKAWVAQQSGITGGTVNITAKDTTLTGAVIAAQNSQGEDNGQLTLTTGTLTVADIKDTDTSQNIGIGYSVSGLPTGETSKNTDPDAKDPMDPSQSTYSASFNGHDKQQTTNATIGLGNVTVAGTNIDEQPEFADLNRDTNNSQETTKDMERGGLDMSLTVDNRMLTEKGRDQIAEDILKSGMLVDTAVLAATTDRVGLSDFNEELGKTHKVYETVKEAIANDSTLAAQLQDPNLSAADKEVMLDQITHAVMSKLGYETEGYENKVFADETAVAQDENGNLGAVAGFYSEQTGDSYINDANISDTAGLVFVAGHESSHAMDDQDSQQTGITYSHDDKETYANNFGNNLGKYTDFALGFNGYDGGMASTNNHVGNGSEAVAGRNKEFNSLDQSKGDYYLDYNEKSLQIGLKAKLQSCVDSGGCAPTQVNQIQAQLSQLEALDKKREIEYATACSGSANNDCNNEMGKAGLAYRSYDKQAKEDGGFIANKELAAEQDHTRNLMFNVSSNIDTEYVAPALDNVDIMAGAFSLNAAFSGLSKAKNIVEEAATATSKVNTVTAQAGSGVPSSGSSTNFVTNKTINDGYFEILAEAPIRGTSRSAHRTSANKAFAQELSTDTSFSRGMDDLLGADVLSHMQTGKGALKNPPGTQWHHPKDNPEIMQLLRKDVHQDKTLQNYLHEDGTGGFSDYFK